MTHKFKAWAPIVLVLIALFGNGGELLWADDPFDAVGKAYQAVEGKIQTWSGKFSQSTLEKDVTRETTGVFAWARKGDCSYSRLKIPTRFSIEGKSIEAYLNREVIHRQGITEEVYHNMPVKSIPEFELPQNPNRRPFAMVTRKKRESAHYVPDLDFKPDFLFRGNMHSLSVIVPGVQKAINSGQIRCEMNAGTCLLSSQDKSFEWSFTQKGESWLLERTRSSGVSMNWEWGNVDGFEIPIKLTVAEPDKTTTYKVLESVVNKELDSTQFKSDSLACQKGDYLADYVEHKLFVYDGESFRESR